MAKEKENKKEMQILLMILLAILPKQRIILKIEKKFVY